MKNKVIFAFVGMPGSGKSEAAAYLKSLGIPFIRFGQFTEDKLKEIGLSITPENEKRIREQLRREFGMEAYAVLGKPYIEELLQKNPTVCIDGLYSWEEYVFLKNAFPMLTLINIFTSSSIRYKRLARRKIRPLLEEEAKMRDIAEIETLQKGGPIAIADFIIDNSEENVDQLHKYIDEILKKVQKVT